MAGSLPAEQGTGRSKEMEENYKKGAQKIVERV